MAHRVARVVVLRVVARQGSSRPPLSEKFRAQLLSTGEEFLSVSPWRHDRRESEAERRRLRDGVTDDEWRALLAEVN